MRRKRYLLFPLFFFLFCLPFCAEAQVGEKKLTVEFKNEELSSVFKQLSKISGYPKIRKQSQWQSQLQ